MAKQAIIDQFLSDAAQKQVVALESQLTKMLGIVEKIADTMSKGGSKGSSSSGTDKAKKEYDALANALRQIAKLEADIKMARAGDDTKLGKTNTKLNELKQSFSALKDAQNLTAAETAKFVSSIDVLSAKLEKARIKLGEMYLAGKEGSKSYVTQQKVVGDLSAKYNDLQIAIGKKHAVTVKEAPVVQQKIKLTLEEKMALQMLAAEERLQIQLKGAVAGSYNAMKAQYGLNLIAINKMSTDTSKLSSTDKQLIADTERLSAALIKQKMAGHNQASGMNNAYNSTFQLTQVMRELPNFAIDARIGFMALSNNLPMLADGFKQISNSIDKTTGKMVGNMGAMKVMAKSLLSLNTVMIVATTLMVMFGDKIVNWIGGLFKGKKAVDDLVKSKKQLHEVMTKGAEDAVTETTRLDLLYNATQNASLSMNDRIKAVDQLQKKYPDYFGNLTDEAILAGNAGQAYKDLAKFILDSARARAAEEKIIENSKEILKLDEQRAWRLKFIAKAEQDRLAIGKEGEEMSAQQISDLEKLNIKIFKYGADVVSLNNKIEALTNSSKGLANNIGVSDIVDKNTESLSANSKALKENVKDTSTEIEKLKEMLAIVEQMNKISDKVPLGTLADRLKVMGETLKDLMSKDQAEQYQKWLDSLADTGSSFDWTKDKGKIISASLDTISKLYDNFYNSRIDQIRTEEQTQINSLNRLRDEELQSAGLSAEDKIAINDEYDRKEYAAKKNAFEREKKLKEDAVWVDAAMGAVRIWAENAGNPILAGILSAFLAGLALDSASKIAATEYPAFALGGIAEKTGKHWVGDGYVNEIGVTPSGKVFLTPNIPTLMELEKGTQIFPDASKFNKEVNNKIIAMNGMDTSVMEKTLKNIERAVSQEKQVPLIEKQKFLRNYKHN